MEHAGYVATRPARARRVAPLAAPGYRAPLRRRPRRRSSGMPALVRTGFTLAFIGAMLLVVVGAFVHFSYQGRVLPGVHAGALNLGGLTEPEAKGVLDVAANPLLSAPAVFAYGPREWRPSAREMGLSVDTAAMAHDAAQAARGGLFLLAWPRELLVRYSRPDVSLHANLDPAQASAFLSAVALEMDRAPVNAALSIRNGQVTAGQSASGQKVDIPATLKGIRLPRTFDDVQRVEVLVTTVDPSVPDTAVAEARVRASKIVASPLTLRLGSNVWTLSPTALGNMVDFKRVDDPAGARLEVALNEAKVAAFVKTVATEVDKAPANAQLRWGGSGVSVVQESRDGLRLDQAAAVKAIVAQAPTDSREVALSAAVLKPAVSSENVSQLGIKELVSTASSKFTGSGPERINNIKVAASRLDGTVIPAGSTFSFLTALGPITKENGYQEGLTILGDETVPGIGGGVCQVSTTVFRAAFFAGLPIVERHQHAYRVGYYEQDGSPVGFDAAVYDPGVDLRFKNDTGSALLLQAGFDPASSTLTFRFYGTSSGREVKLAPTKTNEVKAGPRLPDVPDPTLPKGVRKQIEWKADGVDATIRRTVVQGAQTLFSDSFFSRYAPWQEKWAIGTGPAASSSPAAR